MIEWIVWSALVAPCVGYLVWELGYIFNYIKNGGNE